MIPFTPGGNAGGGSCTLPRLPSDPPAVSPMPPPHPLRTTLAAVTVTLAVLLGGTDRADAAVIAGPEQGPTTVLATTGPVGIDVDGRWFALFAVAFLLVPARRAKRTAAADDGDAAGDAADDAPDAGHGARRPALPAAALDDLDPEVATEVLRAWADR